MQIWRLRRGRPPEKASLLSDAVSFLLIVAAVYTANSGSGRWYSGLVLLIAGLAGFSLTRRNHPSPSIARLARLVWTYAPTGGILTLTAAALSDFGSHFTRVDFGMFYASALQLRTDPAHLYNPTIQNLTLEQVTGGLKNHYLTFPYPPFVAALFVPISFLSFRNAYYVVLACNLITLLFATRLMCASLCKTGSQVQSFVLTATVFLPIYINLILGQMAFVGLLLYALFVIDILENRNRRAGLWTALLSYKAMLVPVPLFILMIRRRWEGVFVAMLSMTMLAGISLALVGANGLLGNLQLLEAMTDASLIPRMQSLRGLVHYAGLPSGIYWLSSLLILGAIWMAAKRGNKLKWLLASAVLANLLISPYVQTYDLSLGLLAVALIVSSLAEISDSKRVTMQLLAFLPGFIAVAGQVTGKNWPAMPAMLLLLFFYCLHKAAAAEKRIPA